MAPWVTIVPVPAKVYLDNPKSTTLEQNDILLMIFRDYNKRGISLLIPMELFRNAKRFQSPTSPQSFIMVTEAEGSKASLETGRHLSRRERKGFAPSKPKEKYHCEWFWFCCQCGPADLERHYKNLYASAEEGDCFPCDCSKSATIFFQPFLLF
jgi:hypothetical protein